MATSQNGYRALTREECKVWKIPVGKGPARHLVLAPGAPGFVLAYWASYFDRYVEDINNDRTWDEWGFAERDIRGSVTLSNHASGTAEDLNADDHPMGRWNTFTAKQRARIRYKLRTTFRGVIRWGGDYQSRPDDMHFEINAPRDKVQRVARRLKRTRRGKRIMAMNQ